MRVFKAIIGGALIGAAFFFVPFFLFRALFFFLIIGLLIRLFSRGRWGGRGWGGRFGGHNRFAFPDYIRSMNDEEYSRFRRHFGRGWDSAGTNDSDPVAIK